MINAVEQRAWTERFYAENGLTLTDEVWNAIEAVVDSAPPETDELVDEVAALLRPVPRLSTPVAVTPGTGKRPDRLPGQRPTGRAA